MAEQQRTTVEVDGHRLVLTNLDKVLYPTAGTTKAEVMQYLMEVAPALLPQLAMRTVTRVRWPHGTGGESFFEKNLPAGAPRWVRRVRMSSSSSRGASSARDNTREEAVVYPLIENVAGLVWLANLAALELHVHQWQVDADGMPLPPDRLVIDLDPGAPAGLPECARVALLVREALDGILPHPLIPVTSGNKGMQLYVDTPGLNTAGQRTGERSSGGPGSGGKSADGLGPGGLGSTGSDGRSGAGSVDPDATRTLAQGLAEALASSHPQLIVARMTKAVRPGKVFLDWSQNTRAKTTICPYSLRGRSGSPTVAAPRTWAEIERAAESEVDLLGQLSPRQVLDRLQRDGDLMAT